MGKISICPYVIRVFFIKLDPTEAPKTPVDPVVAAVVGKHP